MAEQLSLLEFLQKMIDNVGLRDWFGQDPQAAMSYYGLRDVPVDDVRDAITLAEDNQVAQFDRYYDTGLHATPAASYHSDASHSDAHQQVIEHLTRYVTDNHIDDRDTTVDDSLNQHVHTDGGDFTQSVESRATTVSGDGAVGTGGSIDDSAVTSGDGNQVGDGDVAGQHNVVGDGDQVANGDGSTTAFGSGAATSATVDGTGVGGGGALSVGGPADAVSTSTDSHDHTSTRTTDTTDVSDTGNTHADTETNSHNDAHSTTTDDSHDHTTVDDSTHDSVHATGVDTVTA